MFQIISKRMSPVNPATSSSQCVGCGFNCRTRCGRERFIETASGLVSFGIPVWQVLYLLATLLSMSAVITNGLLKSNDLTSKIAQVRGCDAKLEGLEIMLDLEQIDLKQAASLYTQYLTEISHVR